MARTVLLPDFTVFLPIFASAPLIVIFSPAVDPTAAIVIMRFDTMTLILVAPVEADTDGFGVGDADGDADGETVGFGVAPTTLAVTVRIVCTVFD